MSLRGEVGTKKLSNAKKKERNAERRKK